jgi:hypothetical protein
LIERLAADDFWMPPALSLVPEAAAAEGLLADDGTGGLVVDMKFPAA